MNIQKFLRIILVIALVFYCVTAYNGHGYLQEDEHYQIIEFAQLKLGLNQPQDMAWEYHAQMRSATQPFIAYCIFKICYWVKLSNPYILAFLLRLLTALLAIYVITKFVKATAKKFDEQQQRSYIFCAYLLWFLPFINARFSSETWSGLFFLWAIAFVVENNYRYFLIGALLGISFLCRFQSAILAASLITWLLIIQKEKWNNIIKIFSGILFIICIGVAIDCWFYGQATLTPWNYIYNTLFAKTVPHFGDSAWYAYFKVILARPSILIGFPIVLSLIAIAIQAPKNLFLWMTIPFIIIHSIIPHKETRFLFPLINFIPVILFTGFQIFYDQFKLFTNNKWIKFIGLTIVSIIFLGNTVALFAVASRAADGRIAIAKYLHDTYANKPLKIVYTRWADYSTPSLPDNFYRQKNIELVEIDSLPLLNKTLIDTTKNNFLVIRKGFDEKQNQELNDLIAKNGFTKETQGLPKWIATLGIRTKLVFNNEILELYHKQ